MEGGKIVYILGAGFSSPAGAPNQARLLEDVFKLPEHSEPIRAAKAMVRDFLVGTLGVAKGSVAKVALEDIYTPMDRCLSDGLSLRDASPSRLQEVRDRLEYLITLAIERSFSEKGDEARQYIRDFAQHLVRLASRRAKLAQGQRSANTAKQYDPFSIISLNWDIVLDKCLYQALGEQDGWAAGDYEPIGVVDYCCYISSIKPGETRIRTGMWALANRGYNVKLLKIHGSMNWLQCSNCQRLFVSFDEKLSVPEYIGRRSCERCHAQGIKARFQGSLVMPTFLKDLSNFQVKLIWQNTAIELLEARRLVFIGYSLPHADFEFRQLLARMTRRDAKVHVVSIDRGAPEEHRRYQEEEERYRQFFSGRQLTFDSRGVVQFVADLMHHDG